MKTSPYTSILAWAVVLCTLASNPAGAQWTQTNGPNGASVRALCASGSNFFAGTSGGVYFTTNNGTNWVLKGLAHVDVNALAVSGSTLYAAGAGVYRSPDLGATWTEVNTGLTNTDVRSLCIKDSYVFAGTAAGVFRASLSGGSWTSVSSTALSGEMVFSLTASGNFVVAGTMRGGIYRTNDYGATWKKTNSGLTNLSVRALYRSSSGSYLYAGGEGGVHRSTNNGKDWTAMNNGLWSSAWNAIPIVQGLSGTGAKVYAATYNGGVYYSSDRAANWNTTTLQQGSTHSVAVISSNVLAGTHNNGVHRTANNGSTWTAVNNGFRASAISALASYGTNLYAGGFTPPVVSKSTDEGATWAATLPNQPRALLAKGTSVFAGTVGQGLYRSLDNGATWSQASTGGNGYFTALIAKGTYLFAGSPNPSVLSMRGIYRSGDNGATWSQVNNGLTYKRVYAFAVGGTNLFAGTSDGGVFISADDGGTWTQSNSGLTNTNVIALAASGTNLFAGTYGGGVFFSGNSGASWTAVNSGLTNLYISSFAVYGSNVFVGTQGGIFVTADNGTNWTSVSTGLSGSTSIGALEIMGTTLFAGTGGTGVWRRPLAEMISIPKQDASTAPAALRLEQNFPNPFNPSTTISYSLPSDAAVQLRVFDALGREVAVLVNEMKSVGSHNVQFNAGGLNSGLYLYRLEANGAVLGGKMTLMK